MGHRCLDEEEIVRLAAGVIAPGGAGTLLDSVESCAACRELLVEAGVALQHWSGSGPVFAVGEVVAGRYEVTRSIGRGGMGEVFEVLDRELLESVALKTIRDEYCDDPHVIKRFKQELRLARRVVHPNVGRVFELGSWTASNGSTRYFHTMELLAGEPMSRWLRSQLVTAPLAMVLARQLAAGLAAIHGHAIIHRDFKPDNIMVCGSGTELRAVICDFGIARLLVQHNGLVTTALGARMGTPDYMAPEVLNARSPSTASDVFSFGLVLYETLTGEHPLPNPGTRAALGALGTLRVEPLEHRRADLPVELVRLVAECLHTDPLQRPATGGELVRRLDACV